MEIPELEKLIKGCTPGPWRIESYGLDPVVIGVDGEEVAMPNVMLPEEAVTANTRLIAASKSLAAELLEMKQRERWIPTSERIPDHCGPFLVIVRDGGWQELAEFNNNNSGEFGTPEENFTPDEVTFWRELPAPPASDTKAKEPHDLGTI